MAVRGADDVMRLVPSLRRTAAESIPGGFVSNIGTIQQRLQQSLVRERLVSMLATFFAGLAVTLACIGLYGIMAYGVVCRTREIGIRIAIGARQKSVIWMVVRDTLVLVLAGAALGAIVSFVAARYVTPAVRRVAWRSARNRHRHPAPAGCRNGIRIPAGAPREPHQSRRRAAV